jgi:cystathionine beta-lyase
MTRRSTSIIHDPYVPPAGFEAPQPGVFKASTVFFPNVAATRSAGWREKASYTYGLMGTPTTFTLEARIAALEGGLHTVLAPSGLAAIALVDLALLDAGDEVLIPDNGYGPGKELARRELQRWGIGHRFYDPMDPAALAEAITPATRLLWLEAAGSITLEFPDLRALVRIARERGVRCVLDNTWGAGLAFAPFDLGDGLGVDVSVHALTKYPSGGGDVLMGAVTTRDRALHERLLDAHTRFGVGVGANDAEAVLRALPSLELRYEAQDRAAREVAAWLQGQPQVAQLLHPAFAGSPGHEHWRSHCDDLAAGLFSIVLHERYTQAQVDAFVDALRLFRIGYSWGGPISLVVPYEMAHQRAVVRWQGGALVRLSIGLEEPRDLIADLDQALSALD